MHLKSWAGLYFDKISYIPLRIILSLKIRWITPNGITLFSTFIFIVGCILLFINVPYHLYYAASLIFIGYIGDALDGNLARKRNISSNFGAYIDSVVDVLKVYFITISLSIAVYLNTTKVIYLLLGFTACAFMLSRFYIKQIVSKLMLIKELEKNPKFIYNRFEIEKEWIQNLEMKYNILSKTLVGKLKILWLKNKNIFLVNEAEIALFTCLASIFNQLVIWIWILAFSQILIVIFRLFQRGYQIKKRYTQLIQKISLEV